MRYDRRPLSCLLLIAVVSTATLCSPAAAKGDEVPDYPKAVSVPKELESVRIMRFRNKEGDMETHVVLPPVLYLEGHYDGWQKCLLHTMRNGLGHENKVGAPATFEPYTFQGLQQGYADCAQHLESLFGDDSEKASQYCRAHYLPRGVQKQIVRKPDRKQQEQTDVPEGEGAFQFD